jgi:hypothetical protein
MSHRMPSGGHLADAVPRIVGKGWTTVVVGHLGSRAGDGSTALAGIIDRLPAVSGPWGSGHLLSSALFSAVLTSDGRFAVGAVPPHLLYDALARR